MASTLLVSLDQLLQMTTRSDFETLRDFQAEVMKLDNTQLEELANRNDEGYTKDKLTELNHYKAISEILKAKSPRQNIEMHTCVGGMVSLQMEIKDRGSFAL